jgi:hypothetical protein
MQRVTYYSECKLIATSLYINIYNHVPHRSSTHSSRPSNSVLSVQSGTIPNQFQGEYPTAAVLNLLTSADPDWITTVSSGTPSHFYGLNLKTMHKNKQTVNDLQILQNMLLIYLIQKQKK